MSHWKGRLARPFFLVHRFDNATHAGAPLRLLTILLALAATCAATWFAYAPGLAGGFLFDDLVNLSALGVTGRVDDTATLLRYLTSGSADPTGRPLALLSFLLDARGWPADPAPFLRTNLLLHLANGLLLFALLRRLGRGLDDDAPQVIAAALIGAALWMLHPLFVSTTLYIVQREAMLSTTFVLLGLLAYVHGRLALPVSPKRGTAWMVAGIGGGTLLALLCKANGILLPLLAWVLESTLLSRGAEGAAPSLRRSKGLLLVLPSVMLGVWLLTQLRTLDEAIPYRDWTLGQRLLTEPRVLLDYLELLFVPKAMSTGLFNDDYAVSTGWFQPAVTVFAAIAIGVLLAAGFGLRRRAPAVAAAILFFFAGHLLESTVVPLEIYYEHRNYLPAALVFWPIGRALVAWRRPGWQRATVAIAIVALLGTTTWQRARLWGDQDALARAWALQNPRSSRAQAVAAMSEMRVGRFVEAERRLAFALAANPHDLQLVFNHAIALCAQRGLGAEQIAGVSSALRNSRGDQTLAWRWLDRALHDSASHPCPGIDLDTLDRWINDAAANPQMRDAPRRQDLAFLSGKLALLRGDPVDALARFDEALGAWPTASAAAQQASMLAAYGHFDEAIAHLDTYEALQQSVVRPQGLNMAVVHAWVLERQRYWPREIARLRLLFEADRVEAARTASP